MNDRALESRLEGRQLDGCLRGNRLLLGIGLLVCVARCDPVLDVNFIGRSTGKRRAWVRWPAKDADGGGNDVAPAAHLVGGGRGGGAMAAVAAEAAEAAA